MVVCVNAVVVVAAAVTIAVALKVVVSKDRMKTMAIHSFMVKTLSCPT